MNHQASLAADKAANYLAGGGEMAALIRSKDWSETALGPIEDWPQSLRTALSLCLGSSSPVNIIWGPEHIQIYNDAYRTVCGDGHPAFLGANFREAWASAWPVIGAPFESALAGHASRLADQRMFVRRNGYPEETFFTWSASPIRDESGGIGGLFQLVTETTTAMLGQRRARALRDLSAHLGGARTPSQLFRAAIETFTAFASDLPFVLIYEADGAGYRLAEQAGLAPGAMAGPLTLSRHDDAPWPVAELLRTGAPMKLNGLTGLFNQISCGPYEEPPDIAFALPIIVPGSAIPAAILIAGASPRLKLDDVYQDFFGLIAAALTASLVNLLAFQEAHSHAEQGRTTLRETEDDLAFALKAGGLGSWKFDLATRRLTASEMCRASFGADPAVSFAGYRDILSRIGQADRRRLCLAVRHAVRTKGEFNVECSAVRPDGEAAWIMIRGRGAYDGNGALLQLAGLSLDITERKQAEERQKLLLDELNHRVKNTLATVQSLAIQTRTAESPAAYAEKLTARIEALSQAHDLLTRACWEGAELADIVRQTLTPYAFESAGEIRMTVAGPPVRLGPNAAITLNMAFHELAANAARYGALSGETGHVSVRWRVDRSKNPAVVEIIWVEIGGPPATRARRGFGARLVEQGLVRELGGEVRLDFTRSGVQCRMVLPASPKMEPL